MNVWRLSFYSQRPSGESDGTGQRVMWFGSKRAAASQLRQLRAENEVSDEGPCEINAVSVPVDKAGLLNWLNKNLGSDNG